MGSLFQILFLTCGMRTPMGIIIMPPILSEEKLVLMLKDTLKSCPFHRDLMDLKRFNALGIST